MHDWPPLRSFAANAPSIARSRSASSNTISGALPPSSIEVRSTVSEASRSSVRPTSVEPVNDTLRTRSSRSTASLNCEAFEVVTTCTRSAGTPARRASSTAKIVVRGVRLAGLMTAEQPAASAGAILRVAIASGKFHGVMSTASPTGARRVTMLAPPSGASRKLPAGRTASSAYQRTKSLPYLTSPRASARGLPISRLMRWARSSVCSTSSACHACSTSARWRGVVRAQERPASCAVATACRAPSTSMSSMKAMRSPVAGSATSMPSPGRPRPAVTRSASATAAASAAMRVWLLVKVLIGAPPRRLPARLRRRSRRVPGC